MKTVVTIKMIKMCTLLKIKILKIEYTYTMAEILYFIVIFSIDHIIVPYCIYY